jgi:hypothetical protein
MMSADMNIDHGDKSRGSCALPMTGRLGGVCTCWASVGVGLAADGPGNAGCSIAGDGGADGAALSSPRATGDRNATSASSRQMLRIQGRTASPPGRSLVVVTRSLGNLLIISSVEFF